MRKKKNMIYLHGIHLLESRWNASKNQTLNWKGNMKEKTHVFFVFFCVQEGNSMMYCSGFIMVCTCVFITYNRGIQECPLPSSLPVRKEKSIDWMHGRKRLLENWHTGHWRVRRKVQDLHPLSCFSMFFFPQSASLDNCQHNNSAYCYMLISMWSVGSHPTIV